jgi:hypothetical protein
MGINVMRKISNGAIFNRDFALCRENGAVGAVPSNLPVVEIARWSTFIKPQGCVSWWALTLEFLYNKGTYDIRQPQLIRAVEQ